jgi:hypothetical protein
VAKSVPYSGDGKIYKYCHLSCLHEDFLISCFSEVVWQYKETSQRLELELKLCSRICIFYSLPLRHKYAKSNWKVLRKKKTTEFSLICAYWLYNSKIVLYFQYRICQLSISIKETKPELSE